MSKSVSSYPSTRRKKRSTLRREHPCADVPDFELLLIDDVGGTAHRLTGVLHLREGDDVADGVLLEHQHDHAVQTVAIPPCGGAPNL